MISSWIAKFRGNQQIPLEIAPSRPFYAVGDIHGRLDLLTRLLAQLSPGIPVICVGDYIDRGEDSAGVLEYLRARPEILCLKGNHEDMLLSFLNGADQAGAVWLRNGGLQTLASFGIAGTIGRTDEDNLQKLRGQLADAMGKDLIAWLQNLPLSHQSGNIFVTHAGADPATPLEAQQDRHLLWGHPDFEKTARTDGNWVLHGHTIVDHPSTGSGRIAIDTGAFATGQLTAALVEPGEISFVTA